MQESPVSCSIHLFSFNFFCDNCDKPVCCKCITDQHKGHSFSDIKDILSQQKTNISHKTEELRSVIIPVLKAHKAFVTDNVIVYQSETNAIRKNLDSTANDMIEDIRKTLNEDLEILYEFEQSELASAIQSQTKTDETLNIAQNLLRFIQDIHFDDVTCIELLTEFNTKFQQLQNFKQSLQSYQPVKWNEAKGTELKNRMKLTFKHQLSQAQVAVPSPSHQCDPVTTILQRITVDSSMIFDLCCEEENIWISRGNFRVELINCEGKKLLQFSTGKVIDFLSIQGMQGLAVSREGHLLTTDINKHTINKILTTDRKVMPSINCGDWCPSGGICITQNNDIIVSLVNKTGGKIQRIGVNGKAEQDIEKTATGKPIFTFPWYLAVNHNQDICVSDKGNNCVTVVSKTGLELGQYKGPNSFTPYGICVDSSNHMIVADCDNSLIHIVRGDFEIQLIMSCKEYNMSKPRALCVDMHGNVWVGEAKSGKIHVMRYQDNHR